MKTISIMTIVALVAFGLCGCATPRRVEAYTIPETVVICGSDDARCWPGLRLIVVPWSGQVDRDGEPLPDFTFWAMRYGT